MAGRAGKKKKYIILLCAVLAVIVVTSICLLQQNNKKQKTAHPEPVSVIPEQDFSATEEIEAAKKKLEENPEKPTVITDINTVDKEVALCFEGSADGIVIQQILEYLQAHDMQATFFISAVDAGEDQECIDEILKAGHDMESYTLYGTSHMEEMSQEELITDFCRAQVVYEDKIAKKPDMLKCNATEYTDELLEAAEACGYESIVYPTQYLNYQSFYTEETAQNYVAGLGRGRVISVKLNGYLDELEYEESKVDEDPAKDKKPDLELHELEEEELSETDMLLRVVDWLLTALEEQEYKTVSLRDMPAQDMGDLVLKYEAIEDQYEEQLAEPYSSVHTTDRECAFTFRGIGDEEELTNVLNTLEAIGAKATFFVTGKEMDNYPEQIQQILEAGQEIGNGGYSGKGMNDMSFGEICEDIYKNDLLLQELGIETDLFMPPYGNVTTQVQMAASAMAKDIILYNASPARTDYVAEGYTAQEAVQKYFSDARLVLCRGDIVYFNMDVYEDATGMVELVQVVYDAKVLPTLYGTREDNVLRVTDVSTLMDNIWDYPAYTNASYQMVKAGQNSRRSLTEALGTHYIGTSWQELSGFSEGELSLIDREGRVNTGGTNTVFLTFDDWGDEATIGKILYVLKKHKIKASFFIKTQYVIDGSTENLLRAIAEDGHDVGSHTNAHIPIDIGDDGIAGLQKDLVTSNRILSSVIGNTGAMKSYFRPPTLAVNRNGVSTVYDCGYNWIVCGDVSTADYKAESVEDMFDILQNGSRQDDGSRIPVQDGSVVVMHINTNAIYTAQALDRYLNWQEELPEGDPQKFHFAKLSDYLQ